MNPFEQREKQLLLMELKRMWEGVCPPCFRETDPTHPSMNRDKLKMVMDWKYGPKGLLLWGDTGLGKTRCAYLRIKKFIFDEYIGSIRRSPTGEINCPVVSISGTEFAHQCIERIRDGSLYRWHINLCKKPLVLLDDFGKSPFSERVESELFALLDNRIMAMLPTFITTNFNSDALRNRISVEFAAPIIRRLKDYFTQVGFGYSSVRKGQK